MLNLNNYYLHSINPCKDIIDIESTLYILERILESGYILSREKLHMTGLCGFQGKNYISLCDYSLFNFESNHGKEFNKNNTSYDIFALNSLSLIINKNKISVIKPILIKTNLTDYNNFERIHNMGNDKENRYSDLIDEVQVKDQISINDISGIIVPISKLIDDTININDNLNEIKIFINSIYCLLKKYNLNWKIYNLDDMEEIVVKNICKKHSHNFISNISN